MSSADRLLVYTGAMAALAVVAVFAGEAVVAAMFAYVALISGLVYLNAS